MKDSYWGMNGSYTEDKMLENYLLEQLVAFADAGTLSKAAEELHITQPALSKSMRRLEQLFGITLFHRSHSHIELNANGRVAVRYARKALQANNEIIPRTLAFYRRQHTIRIAGCSTIAIHHLIQMCQDFYPTMTLTTSLINYPDAPELLQNENYDLVVSTENSADPQLVGQAFLSEQLMLSVPVESPLAQQKKLSFRDLAGMDILAHAGSGIWLNICRHQIPNVNLLIQENMQSLDQLVKASALPVFSSSMTRVDKEMVDRVTIPIEDDAAKIRYYLLCERGSYQNFKDIYDSL